MVREETGATRSLLSFTNCLPGIQTLRLTAVSANDKGQVNFVSLPIGKIALLT